MNYFDDKYKNIIRKNAKLIRKEITKNIYTNNNFKDKLYNNMYSRFQICLTKSVKKYMCYHNLNSNSKGFNINVGLYFPFKEEINIFEILAYIHNIELLNCKDTNHIYNSNLMNKCFKLTLLDLLDYKNIDFKFYLPIIKDYSNSIIEFAFFKDFSNLKTNKYNILEPDLDNLSTNNINTNISCDIIITPMLVFSCKNKKRIGYGKGYYDKLFTQYNNANIFYKSIGINYDELELDNIVNNNSSLSILKDKTCVFSDYDIPLNYICTQSNIY